MTARRLVLATVVALFALGAGARLAPLVSPDRVVNSISEDGYLMLTVARNVGLGRGMTTEAGERLTNGVQPAVTLVWALLHLVTNGERIEALRGVVLLQLWIALLGALAVRALARRWLADHPWRERLAWAAAALWFAAPLSVRHTTNGLETGAYAAMVMAVLLLDARKGPERLSWRHDLALGASLGLTFLVRNDAVFLVGILLLARVLHGASRADLPSRLLHACAAGATSVVLAAPWLWRNVVLFGDLVPSSGRAQNLDARLGENLAAVPGVLVEYAWGVIPLTRPGPVPLGTAVAFAAALAFMGARTWRSRHAFGLRIDRQFLVLTAFGAALALYYGVFFGASYFLSRYLFPVAALGVVVLCAWLTVFTFRWRVVGFLLAGGLLAVVATGDVRAVMRGASHPHMHVVRWVQAHVPASSWVAAPQSGTLGYFHDRTVNLDGKVNPDALRARRDRRLFAFIVEDGRIEYIADWYGLARWFDRPASVPEERDGSVLRRHFGDHVRSPEQNLFVLKRR